MRARFNLLKEASRLANRTFNDREIEDFLNKAQEEFVKERYGGDYVWQLQALPRILWFQVRNRLNNSLMRLKCHIKNLFQNQVHLLADTEKYMKQMKYTE